MYQFVFILAKQSQEFYCEKRNIKRAHDRSQSNIVIFIMTSHLIKLTVTKDDAYLINALFVTSLQSLYLSEWPFCLLKDSLRAKVTVFSAGDVIISVDYNIAVGKLKNSKTI